MRTIYVEVRKITSTALKVMCMEHDWYTLGTRAEYNNLLYNLGERKENITIDDIAEIAEDILEKSDTECGILEIMREVSCYCFSHFNSLEIDDTFEL